MTEEFKQVSQSLGESPQFGIFSGKQFVVVSAIFVTIFGILTPIFGVSIFYSLSIATWASVTCGLLSGNNPHKFWSKFYPPIPYWVRGQARYISPLTKERLGNQRVKVSRYQTKKLHPFEDWLELATIGRLEREGFVAGTYVLGKNNLGESDSLQLVFGFECEGIHPLLRESSLREGIAKAIEDGAKEINEGETVSFRWSSFCNYKDVREHLKERLENPVSPESIFLDCAQLARVQSLSNKRMRKAISLKIYATFTVRLHSEEKGDELDKLIDKVSKFWAKKFESKANEISQKRLSLILNKAIDAALRYQQIFSEMGLSPKAQNEHELWSDLSDRLGASGVEIPHLLIFDNQGLREEFGSDRVDKEKYTKVVRAIIGDEIHASSRLLRNGVPFADRRWVCLSTPSGAKKYVGVMVLSKKPEGFAGTKGQMQFLWDVFSRDSVYDCEVITEVSPADRGLNRSAQQMITRRARILDLNVQARKSVDVSAQINTERSVDAQRRLYTGDVPLNISVVVLVYRDTTEEVDDACRMLAGYIHLPTELEREIEYAWRIWLKCLVIRQEANLIRPYNRRLTVFASEMLGFSLLLKVAVADKRGFELIADEGNSPINIDFSQTKNVLVLGTTGSGKSLLVASIIAECLALGMSFLIVDLPNDDGSGTFGDFTPYFNGFYFDISRESNNLMQPLDLRNITDEPEKIERTQAHRNDVNLIISQLVLGSQSFDGFLVQTIESLIPLGTNAFYEDPDIQRRFAVARRDGLGSLAWENTPTLRDLMEFFSPKHIDLGYEDENVERALNHIRLRIRYWLASAISKAIGLPSSFDTDANQKRGELITFALTNLQSDKEAEIFGLSAYIAASRQSLSSPNSALFMDEASVLLRFNSMSRLIGRKCATARKSGSRVILAGQDAISIAKSEAGEQILQNMPCRLIGRIVPGAAPSYLDTLGIPREIISQNESFKPNIQESYTRWLLDYNNNYIQCRYYPSYPILALTANSREEQAARDRFKEMYSDKFEWVSEFSKYYLDCMKQGKSL